MRKADKIAAAITHVVRVKAYAGSYIATGSGQRTSCTSGTLAAADAHARKLFNDRPYNIVPVLGQTDTFRATAIATAQKAGGI